jgi:AcrR family transcriptional regulator
MREIARACNINVGTLYYYFDGKEDILYLIIMNAATRPEGWRQDLEMRCKKNGAIRVLREFIDSYYHSVDTAQDICLFTYQETRNLDKNSQRIILKAAEDDVETCSVIMRAGVLSGDFTIGDITMVAHDIIALGHMWAVRRWFLRHRYTLDEYIQEQADLFFARITPGISANKQKARATKWKAKQVHHA